MDENSSQARQRNSRGAQLPGEGNSAGDWRRIGEAIYQTARDFFTDSGPLWAAAIAFYSLLSAFPLMLGAIIIGSYFMETAAAVDWATRLLATFLPMGEEEMIEVVEEALEARGTVGLISLTVLFWSGSRVFSAVTIALNIAYDVDEHYGFLKRTMVEFTLLLTLGALFVLALGSRMLLNVVWDQLAWLPPRGSVAFNVVTGAASVLLLFVTFFLVYHFVPRRKVDWRANLTGAILATLLFMLAQPLFTGYLRWFANYNILYGSLAIIVVVVLWAWIVAMILLFGGEVAAHIQDMVFEGKSRQEVEERHLERSPVRAANHRPDEASAD
jgi:membrane protein